MTRPPRSAARRVAGRGAALVHRQPDLVRELASALNAVMDAFVDVDGPALDEEQWRALELAEAAVAKVSQQGVAR